MRKWLILAGLLLLSAASLVFGTVYAKYRAVRTVPLTVSVPITRVAVPEGGDYVYDGAVHGIAFTEEKIVPEGVTAEENAGEYTAVFTLRDPVTECWEDGTRDPKTVSFRIVRRPIVLSSESAVKSWDGTPLREGSYQLLPGILPEGSFLNVPEGTERFPEALAAGDTLAQVIVSGEQTDAGSSANTIGSARITRPDGRDVTGNYDVSYVPGTLTVEPLPIDLPENAVYKWNGEERSIGYEGIADALRMAVPAGITVLDANGNDVAGTAIDQVYFDAQAHKLFATGEWNRNWTVRMALAPDRNHYWSVPLMGEVTDERIVTLQILPELGNAKDIIIAADDRSMVDGFSASGLAGLLGAPIISAPRGQAALTETERTKIARLASPEGARIWLMGGTGAVSSGIEEELRNRIGDPELHITGVQRISGKERYSTAWHIFEAGHGETRLTEAGWNDSGTVIILPGANVEPTLSIMTYAYAARTPVLLTKNGVLQDYVKDADGDGVYETTISAEEMLQNASFRNAILVGPPEGSGNTYISAQCEAQFRAAVPSVRIMRINGVTIGAMSNALTAWMESASEAEVMDPNVFTTGNYTYIAPEASPGMQDSGRVVNISDYEGLFREIDVLGNAHLYVRTSALLPYRYTLTLSDGDEESGPVLQGWMPDDAITEVFFGSANDPTLHAFRPAAPEGYRFAGLGAAWFSYQHSYEAGVLRIALRDSYLGCVPANTRQAVLYAVYVEEGKSLTNPKNYMRYKGTRNGGTYEKTLVPAPDFRIIVPVE